MLVYVLGEWILFTVFCSMFSEPQSLVMIFNAKDIWPHQCQCGQLYHTIGSASFLEIPEAQVRSFPPNRFKDKELAVRRVILMNTIELLQLKVRYTLLSYM